ncbi:hypothetical protein EDD21DRAFT_351864 [Dissophora ornata]|nr:hypothetical protein EDD21DRAFT_351864 [Dissophora ornata]
MANEGIQASFQPRPGYDRHLFKANAGNRGNRPPYGNDGAFDHANQFRNHNHRGYINYDQSVGIHNRGGNYNSHHRDTNSNINNKGTRARNQQHGHQQQSNGDYRRQENSAKNNFSNHSQHYYRSNSSYSPHNHRKHSNDSGVMLSNTNQGNTVSHSPPYGAYSHGGVSAMPGSLSDKSAISQTMNHNSQGYQSPQPFGAHSQVAVDGSQHHAEYMSHQHAQSSHRTSEQPIEVFNSQQPSAMSNHGHLVPPEASYPQQQFYQMPWGYHPSHMTHLVPPMIPTASPPQRAMYEDTEEKPQPSPLQMATSSMSAGAYGDQEQGHDRLREQLEWYFSTRNLATDTYLVSKMNADHWVSISVVADFKKVKALTDDLQKVVDALRRSNKVSVDATGTMVKAITVDRPRTTLILRELPDDTEEEEIRAIFNEANCPAKLVTKEAVGNMWFIEFETASDALAMLNYTRGRYLREVPIAARLKSNSVLAGGEYDL